MRGQSLSVKRAEVEFHNFASLGNPESAIEDYARKNERRRRWIRAYAQHIGEMSPFLEIGANVGHSSYMLVNEFGAHGFALDISEDSLRYGAVLQQRWNLPSAPVRIAGDAANLPFADNSIRFIAAFQMLSQFIDMESVFREAQRVLAPGGVFLFAEEPIRRLLSLRLYRCTLYQHMNAWERKLYDRGLLGYLVRDVVGAQQEESIGIRQNHTMGFRDWDRLIRRYFVDPHYEIFAAENVWGERLVQRVAARLDREHPERVVAHLLGGTISAISRKAGAPGALMFDPSKFERHLRCPDCHGALGRTPAGALQCVSCNFQAAEAEGVYNLLPSREKRELYPGDREDVIDFSRPGHEARLLEGWYELEGAYGNKHRWMGSHASARLSAATPGPRRLRIRGYVCEGHPVKFSVRVNGESAGAWNLVRPGPFVVEPEAPQSSQYEVALQAHPTWSAPPDERSLSVSISMIRLIGANDSAPASG